MLPRSLIAAAAIGAATLASASPAAAGPSRLADTVSTLGTALLPKQDPACADPETTKPFAAFGDLADYVPVPNGSFESGLDGWTPRGRVSLTDDNEPWKVGGDDHTTAAALQDGASITSGSFCGGLEYPTVRMFARSEDRAGLMLVTVLYTGRDNLLHALPIGVQTVGGKWSPSGITLTASGLPLLTGVKLAVSVTSLSGDVTVDDLYVDPYRRS
ncbi:MAG: hypothetical protein Q7T55_18990 [Solirubrobacteraceae bacterium]|nr:hypothetical protein [Solirubrobacteraceae bacterium]